METRNKIVIATRKSMLALWQAEWIKSQLMEINPDFEIELNKIKTTGDKILDVPLAQVGGKGLFVKEIEEAMLRNEAEGCRPPAACRPGPHPKLGGSPRSRRLK